MHNNCCWFLGNIKDHLTDVLGRIPELRRRQPLFDYLMRSSPGGSSKSCRRSTVRSSQGSRIRLPFNPRWVYPRLRQMSPHGTGAHPTWDRWRRRRPGFFNALSKDTLPFEEEYQVLVFIELVSNNLFDLEQVAVALFGLGRSRTARRNPLRSRPCRWR